MLTRIIFSGMMVQLRGSFAVGEKVYEGLRELRRSCQQLGGTTTHLMHIPHFLIDLLFI